MNWFLRRREIFLAVGLLIIIFFAAVLFFVIWREKKNKQESIEEEQESIIRGLTAPEESATSAPKDIIDSLTAP